MYTHGIESVRLAGTELAANRDLMVGIAPFLVGLAVVAILIGAVWLGIRVKKREPAAPRPEEQPRAPQRDHPPGEMQEVREPNEVPQDGVRRTPHQLGGNGGHGNAGTRPAAEGTEPPKWGDKSGGAFGSGGTGG
ncbi:DUF6479 family protein [Streptomyces candidus]|uniref:Secreted protein n=1 Tax=Streptomyces candidus TaxID=67283 RepID=A0A7X0HHZ6_9ACTN|nr:DUF6479 family protein [Streptomyces candidus]MBB6438017.1 hypothetical protein [Streptomyces candidus]GHH39612.1 hypothetical protein GCM10018773_19810 [Streptomyces candidus]